MGLFRLIALIAVLTPVPASAFKASGFASGMTPDQVRAAAPKGYALRLNGNFGFVEKGGELYATVTFCRGKLVSLSRTVDAKSEWFSLADTMTKQYGNPRVSAAANPWSADPKATATGVEMSWRAGLTKYALTSYPAQPGQGPAKPPPSATLSVTDFGPANACIPRPKTARHTLMKTSVAKRGEKHAAAKLHHVGLNHPPLVSDHYPYSGLESLSIQTAWGAASVRYPPRSRDDASNAAPPPAPKSDSPVRRFFKFLKERFGSGDQTQQVASSGGKS